MCNSLYNVTNNLKYKKNLQEQPDNTLPGTWRYCTITELVTGQK